MKVVRVTLLLAIPIIAAAVDAVAAFAIGEEVRVILSYLLASDFDVPKPA